MVALTATATTDENIHLRGNTNNSHQSPSANHNGDHKQVDPATTDTDMEGKFPPCTAEKCTVNEVDKKAALSSSKPRPSCEMTEKCVNACAAYGRVCPCAARIASHAACDAMQELQINSKLFAAGSKPDFTYFNAQDIKIGKKLGEGGFSFVNECTLTVAASEEHPEAVNHELAVKYLKRKAMVDLHHFKHGAADLAVEAYFLQTLTHPNIVKLHGITAGSVETNVATGKECGFFILVDLLNETLERKIEYWRWQQDKVEANTSFIGRRSAEYKEARRSELLERCNIALSIARAMEYLHSLNIIYRDLKPDNIGFDKQGTLKIFDFGLAKELKHPKEDGTYDLTGHTGSRRYMAPEVAQDMGYNLSVDVYSFGILLWELCSAEKPFYGYSSNKHMQLVVLGGERPKMDSAHTHLWPVALQNLMKTCWSTNPAQRPTFTQIIQVLEQKVCCLNPSRSGSDLSVGAEESATTTTSTTAEDASLLASAPPRAFSRLFPAKRPGRSKSSDVVLPPVSGATLKALKPSSGTSTRARTWGFSGARR
ncbi:hypothetical protein ACA910_014205 [Epithemia clementina (nom. ined.)]